jgi:hypothetical protein
MNAIPLVEVIYRGRSPSALLFMYWVETALLVVVGAIRIVVHQRATDKAGHCASTRQLSDHKSDASELRRSLGGPHTYLRSFLGITVIFTVVHGIFIALLVFLFQVGGPLRWEDARIALLWVAGVELGFLLVDLPGIAGWTFARLQQTCGQGTLRVLVTQIGLIFGIPAIGLFGSPWGMVGVFVGMRALADTVVVWLQGMMRRKDLPPGLVRFLSRRSKQTPETLEAEFDALKESSREIDALLELRRDELARGTGQGPAFGIRG